MSTLSDDKQAIEGGRSPLKDVDAPLRDRIPARLRKQLLDDEVNTKVQKLWSGGNSHRSAWLDRQKTFLKDWDEFLESDAEGPFSGASRLHVPMPLTVVKTFHARMLQAILGMDPSFTVKPRTEAGTERAPMIQELMSYTLKEWINHRQGMDDVLDAWLWDWITTGVGILKMRWDCTYTRFMDVVEEIETKYEKVPAVRGRGHQIVPVRAPVQKEKLVTKKTFEGPICEHVHPEDVLIVGGQGDPDRADAVIHRQYLTASELWTLADRKIFDRDTVKAIIDGGPDTKSGSLGSDIKDDKATNTGVSGVDTDLDLDRYEILEAYLSTDVEGDGINSEVVVWVHAKSGAMPRATYLHRVNRAGERPFVKIDFHKRAGADYGTGLVEMLHPLSVELDFIHNYRLDSGLLQSMPFFFYRPTSALEAEKIEIEPGMGIPLDNPQTDVYFPNLGNRTAFGFQEEGAIQQMVERLTSISDMSMGVISGQQGAARTASGVRALMGEQSSSLDVFLRRMNRGYRKFLEYNFHMLQQRIPEGFAFRVTGDGGATYFRVVKMQDDIAGDFDFEISPNSSHSNPAVQQQVADEILQLTSNPLDIQLGSITPGNRYEALKNAMVARGVKDYGRYITKPQGHARVFTPIEEANRLLAGMDVPLLPDSDHEGFIQWWEMAKGDDQILGQFNEEQTLLLEAHAMKHAQMLQALQAMQAQQANAAQMQRNAAMSQQQSPAGMNPMAAGAGGPPANAGPPAPAAAA